MKKKNGGSAYPYVYEELEPAGTRYRTVVYHSEGMNLRDYFAGQALSGILAGTIDWINKKNNQKADGPEGFAYVAYSLADAMLVEREKEE